MQQFPMAMSFQPVKIGELNEIEDPETCKGEEVSIELTSSFDKV